MKRQNFTWLALIMVVSTLWVEVGAVRADDYAYRYNGNAQYRMATVTLSGYSPVPICLGPTNWSVGAATGNWTQTWNADDWMPKPTETNPVKLWYHDNAANTSNDPSADAFHQGIRVIYGQWGANCNTVAAAALSYNSWFIIPTGLYGALLIPYGNPKGNWQEKYMTTGLVSFPTRFTVTTDYTTP